MVLRSRCYGFVGNKTPSFRRTNKNLCTLNLVCVCVCVYHSAVIGRGRLGSLPPAEEERLPSFPAEEEKMTVEADEEGAVTAFTAVTAAAWEALSFALAWQREQQGDDLPTESSAGEGGGEGVERLSPFQGDAGAAEDEVRDPLRSSTRVPSSSLTASSERVESRSPPEGDSSATVGGVVEDSEVVVNAARAERQDDVRERSEDRKPFNNQSGGSGQAVERAASDVLRPNSSSRANMGEEENLYGKLRKHFRPTSPKYADIYG